MPRAQQPARALPPNRLGDFQQPPFEAIRVAFGLDWQPRGMAPRVPVERRILGDIQAPPFAALYVPAGLQWQPSDRYAGRALVRPPADLSVYPLQPPVSTYDPQNLEWIPSGRYPQIPVERRLLGDFQQPNFQALYAPSGVQWLPQGKATATSTERRLVGDFQQPAFDALFKSEGLSWQASDRYAGRPIAYSLQARFLIDPLPIETAYDPAIMVWVPQGAAYPQVPIELRRIGDFQQPPFDTSSPPTPPDVPTTGGGGGGSLGGKWEEKSTALRTVRRKRKLAESVPDEIVTYTYPPTVEPIHIGPIDISKLAESLVTAPVHNLADRLISDQRLRQSIGDDAERLAKLEQEEHEAIAILLMLLDE